MSKRVCNKRGRKYSHANRRDRRYRQRQRLRAYRRAQESGHRERRKAMDERSPGIMALIAQMGRAFLQMGRRDVSTSWRRAPRHKLPPVISRVALWKRRAKLGDREAKRRLAMLSEAA
jgi:hypothetical protein